MTVMKTLKYILYIGIILSMCVCSFSCVDDMETRRDDNWCDGKTLLLTLNAPENEVISPMTKSSQADTTFTDLNVLVYDTNGLKVFYYNDDENKSLMDEVRSGAEKQLALALSENATGTVYAIANYGHKIDISKNDADKKLFSTAETLENARFKLDGNKPKLYLYAKGESFDVNDTNKNKVKLNLERIYSIVTVQIVKNLTPPSGQTFDIIPTSVQIRHIPNQGQFKVNNKIGVNDVGCMDDGEILEDDLSFLDKGHPSAPAFYLYENRQPDGTSLNNNTDQKTKTPAGLPADEIVSVIKQNKTCSYIEVKAKYVRNNNETGAGSGTIIYRFFLGQDIYKNFDIVRNAHFQVTLTLNGKGGADEATWRVETKLYGEIQVPDVYIGYRAGSEAKMYVTGDGMKNISSIVAAVEHTPAGGSKDNFKVSGYTIAAGNTTLLNDNDGKGDYIKIQSDATNVHDYDKKIGIITFRVSDNGVEKDFKAKVYQVPRLVDPIAIYKKAENDSPTTIVVKEFAKDAFSSHGGYIPLVSKGRWTATIESSNDGNWFEIYTSKNGGKDESNCASAVGKTIEGEGEVTFVYDPINKNLKSADGDGGAVDAGRYGKISVRYHDANCEHEIFLRQGYQPMKLGDEEYAWSAFNCLGKKDANSAGEVTQYPTQTGWLFYGGVDIAMHPFKPGYREGNVDDLIELSSSNSGDWKKIAKGTQPDVWQEKSPYVGSVNSSNKRPGPSEQGPCPKNYIVADAWTYRKMTVKTYVYTGYVHDDDFQESGWNYNTFSEDGGAIVYNNNHCNPAKGSLFVERGGCKNLFFNYGKGVMKGVQNRDARLIDEIGVGRRFMKNYGSYYDAFPQLTYTDPHYTETYNYGAFYWSATPFNGDNMGKVDFGYDMFKREPNLIDVPGELASIDGVVAKGIDRIYNPSFVRCVLDISPNMNVKVNAKFYRQTEDKSYRELIEAKAATFSCKGVNATLVINDGYVISKLEVPKGTLGSEFVTIRIDGWGSMQVTLDDLQKSSTEVVFTDPILVPQKMIDIKAQFVSAYGNTEELITGKLTVTAYDGSVKLSPIDVENGFATTQWKVPPSYDDNVKVSLLWVDGLMFKQEVTIGTLKTSGKIVLKGSF